MSLNTWTCENCQNVNSNDSTSCLKCSQNKLSHSDLEALRCRNLGVEKSGWAAPMSEGVMAKDESFRIYITTFYQEARKDLLIKIDNLEAEIKNLQKDKPILGCLKPSVGDKIWTKLISDGTVDPNGEAVKVEVDTVGEDAFFVICPFGKYLFFAPRYYTDFNKTWWLQKPAK